MTSPTEAQLAAARALHIAVTDEGLREIWRAMEGAYVPSDGEVEAAQQAYLDGIAYSDSQFADSEIVKYMLIAARRVTSATDGGS